MLKSYSRDNSKSEDIQLKIDTKIDWASLVYHLPEKEEKESCHTEKDKIIKEIINVLNIDIDETSKNLLRDSNSSIAIFNLKKSIKVELEGSFFKLDGNSVKSLKGILKKLNNITEKYDSEKSWSLSRLDIAKTIKNITLEELIPDSNKYLYDFRHKKIEYKHSSGILETLELRTSKIEFCFYRKDIQWKTLWKSLQDKKILEKDYKNQPTTRAEVRFKSGSETLLIALKLLKEEISEIDFCDKLLRHGTQRRNVKIISNNNKQKSLWEIEPRWKALFHNCDMVLKVDNIVLNEITRIDMPDITLRELNRLRAFMKRTELSLADVSELLKSENERAKR